MKFAIAVAVAIAIAAALLSGCTAMVGGQPRADPTLPVDDFPSTVGLHEVDSETFWIRDGNPEYGFGFVTPNGLTCDMTSYISPEYAHASCWGLRPDRGPGYWEVYAEKYETTTISAATPPDPTEPVRHEPKELPRGSYVIDSPDTLCAVTDDLTVACHVGGHGFILTATSSVLF